MSILFNAERMDGIKGKISEYQVIDETIKVGVHLLSIRDLLGSVLHKSIMPYGNNRGGQSLNRAVVKGIVDGLSPISLGQICVGWLDGRLCIADGHSRIEGLLQRMDKRGRLSQAELNHQISVEVISHTNRSFFEVYRMRNTVQQHTSSQKLLNPDFFFGSVFSIIRERVGEPAWSRVIGGRKATVWSYVIYRLCHGKSGKVGWSFADLYCNKGKVQNLRYELKDSPPFSVSSTNYDKIVDAVLFCNECYEGMDAIVKSMTDGDVPFDKKTPRFIIASAPLMALVATDHISGEHTIGTSAARVASRIMGNTNDLMSCCYALSGTSRSRILQTESRIFKMLSPRS